MIGLSTISEHGVRVSHCELGLWERTSRVIIGNWDAAGCKVSIAQHCKGRKMLTIPSQTLHSEAGKDSEERIG